ncbi:hypothetical protein CHS0354_034353 [Potamilus streckersoni]|uniref:Uncharacterized protein n=1 Tax=Potamilus streckersoni TaxID=2493646 RepID=A0AAE0TKL6_9BIVA|nr:hypothetical protein CHS0354_034353 [Potamilus streckersoni]
MEEFVRKLVATSDLSILSKKMVRQHYMTFSGKTSLTPEEKDGISNFIDQLLQEISEGKEISPTRPKIKDDVKDLQKENKATVVHTSQPTTPKGVRKRKRSLSKSPGVKDSPKRSEKSTKKRFSLDEVVDILNKSDETVNKSDTSDDDQPNDSPVSSPANNSNRERDSSDLESIDENYDNNDSDDSFSSGHDSESEEKSSCKQNNRKSKAFENKSEFFSLRASNVKAVKSSKLKNVSNETDSKKNESSKEEHTFNSKDKANNKHGRRVKTFIDSGSDSEISDTVEKTSISQLKVEDSGLDVQSDSEAESSFSDSPVKTSHKRQIGKCIESTDSEDDEDSNNAKRWQASRQFANHNSLRHAEPEQVSSDSEFVEEEKQKSQKNDDKKDDKNKKNQKTSKNPQEKKSQNKTVEHLKRICKASGIFLRGKKSLKDCTTEKEMIERMKEILKEAGMEGKPTLEKAEELRLMTEAAELDTGNILSEKSAVGKRKVQSLFARRAASPSPVKESAFTGFSHLKDLVDSDASSDD